MGKNDFQRNSRVLGLASLIAITVLCLASPNLAKAERSANAVLNAGMDLPLDSPAQRDQLVDAIRPGTPQYAISVIDSQQLQKTIRMIERFCAEGPASSKSVWTRDYCRQEVGPLVKSAMKTLQSKTGPALPSTVQARFVQGN